MVYALTPFVALFSAVLTLMLGSGLLGTLLSVRMTVEGYSGALTGLIMSGFYVGMILGFFICPRFVRGVGHIRTFTASAAVLTASVLLHALFVNPVLWWSLRLVSGVGMMGLYMVVESWLSDRSEPSFRGRIFSVYMAMTFFGMGGGQLLLNVAPVDGETLFMLSGILFAVCLIPVALTRSTHPELPEVAPFSMMKLLAIVPQGMMGSLVAGMVNGAFFSLGPVFGMKAGLSVKGISLFMGITVLSGLILQWPVGTFSDRFDRRRVLGVLNLMVAFSAFMIILVTGRSLAGLLIIAGIYGGLAFTTYPVAVALTNDHVDPAEVLPASAALILFYSIGALAGPLLAAGAMALVGPPGVFMFIVVSTALAGLGVIWGRTAPVPRQEEETETAPFVVMPRTSPVIISLHPAVEEEESESAGSGEISEGAESLAQGEEEEFRSILAG